MRLIIKSDKKLLNIFCKDCKAVLKNEIRPSVHDLLDSRSYVKSYYFLIRIPITKNHIDSSQTLTPSHSQTHNLKLSHSRIHTFSHSHTPKISHSYTLTLSYFHTLAL